MSQPGILPGASYSQSVALSTELPYAIRAILLLDENHVIIRCPSRASYLEPLTKDSYRPSGSPAQVLCLHKQLATMALGPVAFMKSSLRVGVPLVRQTIVLNQAARLQQNTSFGVFKTLWTV
ncbi:hypothetical protein RRG08_002524 [Elysia crispata]|uniref:Uncharacterized protein n=1 Tax=Elysia crispata TaxID=231223 RepID=A0AAE1DTW8_9GAST|nr:hypothetical protein RRG08_002524 [Elysia crispata]